jgi:hypothetical protein
MIAMKNGNSTIKPFERCPALDGYHCQTNSLAKIFHYRGHPLSEDVLLGLGAGSKRLLTVKCPKT